MFLMDVPLARYQTQAAKAGRQLDNSAKHGFEYSKVSILGACALCWLDRNDGDLWVRKRCESHGT